MGFDVRLGKTCILIVDSTGLSFTASYTADNPSGADDAVTLFKGSFFMDLTYLYVAY